MTKSHLRLLLVEDSADDAELIARILHDYALEVSRVDSEEALRKALAENEFDVALTDHVLPGFDSEGVLETLAELSPELPCLLVSGKVGEEAVGTAMRQGAVDYVAKDGLEGLPAAIERTLAESERRRERSVMELALARSGHLFRAVFVNARDAMLIVDAERRLVDANPAAGELLAMPAHELTKLKVDDLMPEAWRLDARRSWDEFLAAGDRGGEIELVRADGALAPTEFTLASSFLPGRHLIVMRNIRERRAAEAAAKRHIAHQEAIAAFGETALREGNRDFLHETALRSVAATLGAELASITEQRAGEDALLVVAELSAGEMRAGDRVPHGPGASSQASFTVREGRPVLVEDYAEETRFATTESFTEHGVRSALSVEIPGHLGNTFGVLCAASATPRALEADDATFLTAVANILADALKRADSEDEIRELALHDSLTGLPNRTLFFDRLGLAVARAERRGSLLAVVFLDIDRFKSYNDTLGHRATDRLLAQVGARMERTMRDTDTVARFGGDEFVILCEDLAGEDEAEILTTRLVSAFEMPFSFVEGEQHKLSVSIGVAVSDADNLDGEALVRDADIAMYRSKENGTGLWTMATKEMRLAVVDRSETKSALERAIDADELVLHYQPIVALDGGEISAVEALVRWEHPERGLIPPSEFIPIAEESGLIIRLGEWVLRAACHQAARWREEFEDRAPLPVHVNLSARQVAQQDLPERVRGVLDEYRVAPSDIALEITESALIEGVRGPITALVELKRMGVCVVLDDFGTGFSSLSYLERFPIDTLKIDRAFISKLEEPTAPAPIVTAIVGMARALAVATVAEGVETAAQTAAVALLGCQRAQGYFFARPAPADEISQLIKDNTTLRRRVVEASALIPPVPSLGWAGVNGGSREHEAASRNTDRRSWQRCSPSIRTLPRK
jgi:diguanylate cyclase (GGDEF)-like protein/PAS domain S-box-containing protein